MEVRINYINRYGKNALVHIDTEVVYVEEESEKVFVNCEYEEKANALINLFALKEEWVSERCSKPKFEVTFKNKNRSQKYRFNNNLPSNFFLFNACVSRLLGDLYE